MENFLNISLYRELRLVAVTSWTCYSLFFMVNNQDAWLSTRKWLLF